MCGSTKPVNGLGSHCQRAMAKQRPLPRNLPQRPPARLGGRANLDCQHYLQRRGFWARPRSFIRTRMKPQEAFLQNGDDDGLVARIFDNKSVSFDDHSMNPNGCGQRHALRDLAAQGFDVKTAHPLQIAQDSVIGDTDRLFHKDTPARAHIAFSASTTVAIWR